MVNTTHEPRVEARASVDPPGGRLPSLDGLRGIAALVVVAHHALLTWPAFAAQYLGDGRTDSRVVQALTYTPVHLFWDGKAAVYVFFVLSGLVLTLPVLRRGGRFVWAAYYPQRLVRLYLPVGAAVLLGIAWFVLVPRDPSMQSLWLSGRPDELGIRTVLRDLTLLGGSGGLVSPLWSLRWEILFSLLLPVFAFVVVCFARARVFVFVGALVLIGVGGWAQDDALRYLPMFLLGSVLATVVTRLPDLLAGRSAWVSVALVAVTPVLLTAPWLAKSSPATAALSGPLIAVSALGAVLAVVCAVSVPVIRRMLTVPVMAWLGRISFSLYLVHEPIVIASAHLFGDHHLAFAALVSIPVSVIVAYCFYRAVEVPSHRLSRRVGRAVPEVLGSR